MCRVSFKDRFKDMGFGEVIDGEYIEYEDMSEDQLMDLFEGDYEEEFKMTNIILEESNLDLYTIIRRGGVI